MEEFVLKRKSTKGSKFNIRNSYRMKEAYNWYRKNYKGKCVSRIVFSKIVQNVNLKLADEFLKYGSIVFPEGMGEIYIEKKYFEGVKVVNGKVKVTYPVDWVNTIKLWKDNKGAREAKTLVRFENDYIYKIKYSSDYSNYTNKIFMTLKANTFLKENISKVIRGEKIPIYQTLKVIN